MLDRDLSPDRVLLAEPLRHQGLIHDGNLARPGDLVFFQQAAMQQPGAQRVTVTLAHQLINRLPTFGVRLTGNFQICGDAAVGRQGTGFRGIHYSGKRLHFGQQLGEETLLFGGCFILPFGKRQPRHQDVVRIESEIYRLQRDESPHHDSRAGQ